MTRINIEIDGELHKKAKLNALLANKTLIEYINEAIKEKVEKVLGRIRPNLQADGGDVQLVEVTNGTVKVKLSGACIGCPMSSLTLKMGIERMLKSEVPEVKEVVAV